MSSSATRTHLGSTGFRFDLMELSGSLGDLGTFLPLTVAMAIACQLDLAAILFATGVVTIWSGLAFRQPIPVQPMKAIAAVAIAEGLTRGELYASGLLMGVVMLALAYSGAVEAAARRIPKAVVRGIQIGVGAKLAWKGLLWLGELPAVGADSLAMAGVLAAVAVVLLVSRKPAALLVFGAGAGLMLVQDPGLLLAISPSLPAIPAPPLDADTWGRAALIGALPQLPLTLLNSVLAVCALSEHYFPGRGVSPRRMAVSVGLMNLVGVALGGIPTCHGSGGLAAQVRFGARTGGSMIMLGGLKLAAGLLLGASLVGFAKAFPLCVLALTLVFAGVELARVAGGSIRLGGLVMAVPTAVTIVLVNTTTGFLVGMAIMAIQHTPVWAAVLGPLAERLSYRHEPVEGGLAVLRPGGQLR
jgi:hypothetical protein